MQKGNKTTDPEIDFGEFAPATYAEWREAAVAALKGADFDKKLFTEALWREFTLHPIYNKWDEHSPVMPCRAVPVPPRNPRPGLCGKALRNRPEHSRLYSGRLQQQNPARSGTRPDRRERPAQLQMRPQAAQAGGLGHRSQGPSAGQAARLHHSRFLRPGHAFHVPEHVQIRRI